MKKMGIDKIRRWSSHVPVLRSLGDMGMGDIKVVIEYGCGIWSTRTLLDREYFSDLEELHTCEVRRSWISKVRKMVGDDDRWHTKICKRQYAPLSVVRYRFVADLVFMDGAPRVRYLKHMKKAGRVMVFHDFERDYARPIKRNFRYISVYRPPDGSTPTAICSNYIDVSGFAEKVKWETDFHSWGMGDGFS